MKKLLFSDKDNAILFDLKISRKESLDKIKSVEDAADLCNCLLHAYQAEVSIWTFFQEKLSAVNSDDEFWELVSRMIGIFGDRYLKIEPGLKALSDLLEVLRSFVTRKCLEARGKLHGISI